MTTSLNLLISTKNIIDKLLTFENYLLYVLWSFIHMSLSGVGLKSGFFFKDKTTALLSKLDEEINMI